jgi:hypothetical protein
VNRTNVILIGLAVLAFAAWINAAQERRVCGPCSPATAMLPAFAELPR